jgi:hypothetical protein
LESVRQVRLLPQRNMLFHSINEFGAQVRQLWRRSFTVQPLVPLDLGEGDMRLVVAEVGEQLMAEVFGGY